MNCMIIIELKEREDISENVKLSRIYIQFQELLKELRKKELPDKIIEFVNQDIEDINSTSFTGNELRKLVKQKQDKIIKLLEKELKIVPKGYYQNHWVASGMCLGVAFGILFSSMDIFGSIAFGISIATGFSIGLGMTIGYVTGSRIDKKALKEGRQLDVKI